MFYKKNLEIIDHSCYASESLQKITLLKMT